MSSFGRDENEKAAHQAAFHVRERFSAYFETRSLESWLPIWLNTDAVCEAEVIM
jgi:hypothetical protein